MRTSRPILIVAVLAALAACSKSPDAARHPAMPVQRHVPSQADVARFVAEGPDPTLRKLAVADYWLHYKLMQATGIERELGGAARAVAALQALGDAYERRMRAAEDELPKMLPAAFTGEGMSSGFLGLGMGGFVSMFSGGALSGAVSRMSDERLAELVAQGPLKFDGAGGKAEILIGTDGSQEQSMEFEVNEKGLTGRVKLRTRMDGCPDAQGRVTVTVDVDSQMGVRGKPGTRGYVRSEYKAERYLDDDARLRTDADGAASELRIRMGGYENGDGQHVDITTGTARGGEPIFEHHAEKGFSIFRPDEVQRTKDLLAAAEWLHMLMAEAMLRGMGSGGSPWESGRCVELKATSDPAKRNGTRPNTAFDLLATPRAKSDGKPTGGTVVATLDGGESLLPANGKVPADARYQYAGPPKENETASIAFESRSKRGVGKATLEFDTRPGKAYRITGVGDCPGPWTVCDVGKPFTYDVCGGTMTHSPTGDRGGSHTFKHSGASGSGTYTLTGPEQEMTAIYQNTTCAMGRCFKTPAGKATWTKIERCE